MGDLTKDDGVSKLLDDNDIPLTDEDDGAGPPPPTTPSVLPLMLLMRLRLHA